MISCDHVNARHDQRWFEIKPHFTPQFTSSLHVSFLQNHGFNCGPALNFLKFAHLQSPQCDGTVDLTILMVLLNGWFRSILSSLWIRSSLPKSMTVIYFMIRALRSFKSQTLLFSVCQSSGVNDLRTPVLLNRRLCLYFGNLTFQPRSMVLAPFSINGRDLLRVSGLLKSQVSNFTSPKRAQTWSDDRLG
jgi:hypothetical protein